jgi:hypothetical protein
MFFLLDPRAASPLLLQLVTLAYVIPEFPERSGLTIQFTVTIVFPINHALVYFCGDIAPRNDHLARMRNNNQVRRWVTDATGVNVARME